MATEKVLEAIGTKLSELLGKPSEYEGHRALVPVPGQQPVVVDIRVVKSKVATSALVEDEGQLAVFEHGEGPSQCCATAEELEDAHSQEDGSWLVIDRDELIGERVILVSGEMMSQVCDELGIDEPL